MRQLGYLNSMPTVRGMACFLFRNRRFWDVPKIFLTMVERRDMGGFTFWADNAKEMISLQDVPNKEPEMVSLVDLQATWFTENWLEKVVHEHRSRGDGGV